MVLSHPIRRGDGSAEAAVRGRAVAFLLQRGADDIAHLRGTLFEHLEGTEGLLRSWGVSDTLALAGLCHATYGTDGFAPSLLSPVRRDVLRELVSVDVEQIVYLYASCDRTALYPQLGHATTVVFTDRFSGRVFEPSATEMQQFVDLTLANEVEIALSECPDRLPPSWLLDLFGQTRGLASPAVERSVAQLLEPETV